MALESCNAFRDGHALECATLAEAKAADLLQRRGQRQTHEARTPIKHAFAKRRHSLGDHDLGQALTANKAARNELQCVRQRDHRQAFAPRESADKRLQLGRETHARQLRAVAAHVFQQGDRIRERHADQ